MKTTRPIFPVPHPVIVTERLLLREIEEDDLEWFHMLRTEPEVMKWTSTTKVDVDRDATMTWIKRYLSPNDAITFNYAVEERSNPGIAIGVVGSHYAEPPEIGYMFRTAFQGKGFATEAIKAWLQVYWALPRKEVDIDPSTPPNSLQEVDGDHVREWLKAVTVESNTGSIKVLRKLGFKEESREEVEDNGGMVVLLTFYLNKYLDPC